MLTHVGMLHLSGFFRETRGDDESPPELYSIDAGSPVMEVLRMAQLHGRLQLAAHG